jgi:hypothetical protein
VAGKLRSRYEGRELHCWHNSTALAIGVVHARCTGGLRSLYRPSDLDSRSFDPPTSRPALWACRKHRPVPRGASNGGIRSSSAAATSDVWKFCRGRAFYSILVVRQLTHIYTMPETQRAGNAAGGQQQGEGGQKVGLIPSTDGI